MRLIAPSTCTSHASAPPSRTIPNLPSASSRCAAPATCSRASRIEIMTRLYLRIYATVLASLLAFVLAFAWVWHSSGGPYETIMHSLAQVIVNVLPPVQAPVATQQQALDRLAPGVPVRLALLDDSRRLLAESRARPGIDDPQAVPRPGNALWMLHLPDGRWLRASLPHDGHGPMHVLLLS